MPGPDRDVKAARSTRAVRIYAQDPEPPRKAAKVNLDDYRPGTGKKVTQVLADSLRPTPSPADYAPKMPDGAMGDAPAFSQAKAKRSDMASYLGVRTRSKSFAAELVSVHIHRQLNAMRAARSAVALRSLTRRCCVTIPTDSGPRLVLADCRRRSSWISACRWLQVGSAGTIPDRRPLV